MRHAMRFVSAVILSVALSAVLGCRAETPPVDEAQPAEAPAQETGDAAPPADEGAPKTGEAAREGDELMVLCGTSFGPPMEALIDSFQQETGQAAVISFGGSEDLLPHVKGHSQGDIFVTHDPYMEYTEEAEAMLRWIHVGYVAPVLVVQTGNPRKLEKLGDLTRPGLRVLLPNPEFSTCGEMVFGLMEKKEIKDAVLANVGGAMFRSHSDIGNKMKLRLGDAAVMWNGVAHNFLDAIDIVPGPYEYDEEIRVGVIGLSYSKMPQVVEQFLKYVEVHGKEVFGEFGYVK